MGSWLKLVPKATLLCVPDRFGSLMAPCELLTMRCVSSCCLTLALAHFGWLMVDLLYV